MRVGICLPQFRDDAEAAVATARAAEEAGLDGGCARLRAAGVATWVGGRSAPVRRAAAASDGWNIWGLDAAGFAVEAAAFAVEAGGGGAATSWGGQVLVGRTPAEAAAKLARHG